MDGRGCCAYTLDDVNRSSCRTKHNREGTGNWSSTCLRGDTSGPRSTGVVLLAAIMDTASARILRALPRWKCYQLQSRIVGLFFSTQRKRVVGLQAYYTCAKKKNDVTVSNAKSNADQLQNPAASLESHSGGESKSLYWLDPRGSPGTQPFDWKCHNCR